MKFFLALFTVLVCSGCASNRNVSVSIVDKTESVPQRYELLISFASAEDVKRVPYRLSQLKMELMDESSSQNNLYKVSIECKEFELDGIITKLNYERGVHWAKLVE
ncbi:MAG: hypothetical protein RL266_515 [Bacteroidota bacterium]|jgi:uncharacterized protein YigA (DUF484 family)